MVWGLVVMLLALWLLAHLMADPGDAAHGLLVAALVLATAQRFREVGRRRRS